MVISNNRHKNKYEEKKEYEFLLELINERGRGI